LAGWPCDMPGIMALAQRHGLWVMEDCAQAHGAMIGPADVGRFGTLASLSFCQDKIMTTGGEGGMILTDDAALYEKLWSFKDHGKSRAETLRQDHPPGFRWLHSAGPGTNLRMTGLSAALGLVQLRRLPEWRATRTRNAMILAEAFATLPALRVPLPGPGLTHAFYRFYAFLRPERLRPGWTRQRILDSLAERGLTVFSGSCSEIYREKTFAARGIGPKAPLPVAQELGETSLAFLVDPSWSAQDMHDMARGVAEVLDQASG
ncbi:DegT/DnrJ/EryC1/StrS family aminotransferase, partial [Paracoccus sp. (in: a-proteobacteria)]|uniref:DegT/DnrJ/EryC1/StrS family aminotransferase n=1 Tax=Paracoccus sp. TaxID=267 RepID=UPI0035B474CB